MTIAVVTTGSTYTGSATGGVPNSSNRWAHLGFVAAAGGSGCCMWHAGTAAGSVVLPIVCASGQLTFMSPLMNNPNGFFVSDIYGGSAVIWLRASAS